MSSAIKTEAIVLKKNSLLGKHNLITLFSQGYGKIKVVAYGTKKITSRRLANLQTGNLLIIVADRKNNFLNLQENNLISAFLKIKKDKKKLNFLYFFFFILDKLLAENQKEEQIYNATKKCLIDLSNTDYSNLQLTDYLNQIIQKLGYSREKKSLLEIITLVEGLINQKIPLSII